MSLDLHLQAGGTLNPRQHLYIERREDETFLRLLLQGQYVNVLTSRQMGKSSLMMRTVHRLDERGVRWVTIDLAAELGSPPDLDAYYLGLLGKVARSLHLQLDLRTWWLESDTETVNQRLMRFFREVVAGRIAQPVVIFLDEIDSTLKLKYTDDLFTAIRGMYNERPIVEAYRRITFCLLGVATPNELIQDRRTTPYNVGTTFELRDFDIAVDDLSPLAAALNPDAGLGARLLERVFHWSGGQPYLTQKFCADVVDNHISDTRAVDELVARTFDNLDQASSDIHFQQILRFLQERLSDETATIELYARILQDGHVPDRTTLAHAELKLSGLVKRDRNGNLVVRNPIYRRLFDAVWVENTRPKRQLQAGGTLNPRRHLYIERTEDEAILRLLLEGQYVNVLAPRQMGKSSLMIRLLPRLDEHGVRAVTIDLAGELGSPLDLNEYYLGLLGSIARSLGIEHDLKAWWAERDTETVNQRLSRFFREIVAGGIAQPVVIFLDEIDSTLKLPYTDDLFTAIRGMYNERPIVEAYLRITFCLLGVATADELIKDRRTTPYNAGTTFELRDFDIAVDDLSPLAAALNPDAGLGARLLERVLYWSGGQPYLTQKISADVVDNHISDAGAVDELVTRTLKNLDQAGNDIHFQQILRFMEERLSDEPATIALYAKVLKDGQVPDRTTPGHAELKLSGLVKRDRDGNLVVRNPLYRRLFDNEWIASTRPRRALRRSRRYAIAASLALAVVIGGGATYYTAVVVPEQQRLATLDRLAQLKVSITRATEGDGTRVSLPRDITQPVLREAIPLLKAIGPITEIAVSFERQPGDQRSSDPIDDLSPFADLIALRDLDLSGLRASLAIATLEPLRALTNLSSLTLPAISDVTTLEPLQGLTNLRSLTLYGIPGITSLEPLKGLANLTEIYLYSGRRIISLEPLRGLTNLHSLSFGAAVASLEPLQGLTNLRSLIFTAGGITSLEPLKELTNLAWLSVIDGPGITSLEPLKGLTNLRSVNLSGATGITSLEPLKGVANLASLDLSDATGITSLEPLRELTNLSSLSLSDATGITSLEPLKGVANLESLNLSGATGITSLEPLKSLAKLRSLDLTGATGLTSLEPLKDMTNLRSLDLTGATGITSLAPLKGKPIKITGASRELLATME